MPTPFDTALSQLRRDNPRLGGVESIAEYEKRLYQEWRRRQLIDARIYLEPGGVASDLWRACQILLDVIESDDGRPR